MGFSQIFRLAIVVIIALTINHTFAQEDNNPSCDTSSLESKIDSLSSQTNALNAKVDSVGSTVKYESNNTRSSIVDTLFSFPIFFLEKILVHLTFGILNLDSDANVFWSYNSLYAAKPNLSLLSNAITEISKVLLWIYLLVSVFYSLQLLYAGAVGRAELKENAIRIFLGALLLRNSFAIYSIMIDVVYAITQLFVSYIDFNLLALNAKTIILNIDIIAIFLIVFIILGLICGAVVAITSLFGAILFPLILLCLSMPFERVRTFGESLLSCILGILLAPAISASILGVIPAALQSSSNFLMNRAILLAGIILAILIPLFIIISLILKPVVKVASLVKIVKGVK